MSPAEEHTPEIDLRFAQEIVDSKPVISTYAACEWDELSDDGKLWVGAIVAETRRRVTEATERCKGNLRPAPFAFTPSVVASIVEDDHARPQSGVVEAPVLPIRLVDRPRRSEDPRLAKANDDSVSPGPSVPMDGRTELPRVTPLQAAPFAPVEAPSLGRPGNPRREKIALPPLTDCRQPLRAPARKPGSLPVLPSQTRRAAIEAAIVFLKRRGILVTVCDRQAEIRMYRVTGKADRQFHEDVIKIAAAHGFELPA